MPVLGRDLVGIDDNYFVLGGASIRSVMVASRAQARGGDVTVADLHAQPAGRRLAGRAERERSASPVGTVHDFRDVPQMSAAHISVVPASRASAGPSA